ncbi:MAG: hypothetical protein ABEJ65_00025, partial [bacterium]
MKSEICHHHDPDFTIDVGSLSRLSRSCVLEFTGERLPLSFFLPSSRDYVKNLLLEILREERNAFVH